MGGGLSCGIMNMRMRGRWGHQELSQRFAEKHYKKGEIIVAKDLGGKLRFSGGISLGGLESILYNTE